MSRTRKVMIMAPMAVLLVAGIALAQKPDFSPRIYGDGQEWGTKAVTTLPAPNPNANNYRSFDKLFVFANSNNDLQLPVSEAAPGNPYYNGGRWFTHTVVWTDEGFNAHGVVPLLTSYEEIMYYESLGHLEVTAGSPAGGPPLYFVCPLLPVK